MSHRRGQRNLHLFLAVTAHGYGHLAQSAPVAEALAQRIPGLRVTLQGNIDPWFVKQRLPSCSKQIREPADVGLLMDGPLQTRWPESLREYERFEAGYDRHMRRQTEILEQDPPDLVLADVPWLPLDAAKSLGIPAVALCSLNWYDILHGSQVAEQTSTALTERLRRVYAAADLFIRPTPSMPMDWLLNARDTGPIALRYPNRAPDLRKQAGIPGDRPLVLMQFGGFAGFDPLRDWPHQEQVHWVVPTLNGRRRTDSISLADLGLSVLEVLGSCDAILTKPGYGTVAEAACNGKPVLYVSRPDWPEEPALTDWLRQQVPAREISLSDLLAGRVMGPLLDVLQEGPTQPRPATGIDEAADLIVRLLSPDHRP